MDDDDRIFDNAGEQAAREDFLSGMTPAPAPTNEQLAQRIVDSCMFGYAGNEIDKNATANPDVIEASYKWLAERFAAALGEREAEARAERKCFRCHGPLYPHPEICAKCLSNPATGVY